MAYRGLVAPLPVGQQGFTGTQNPSQAQPGHFVYVDGAELDGGIIRKEGGARKLNEFPLGASFGNDAFTKILLHMDGSDASTSFLDVAAGGSAHTWTAAGDAQVDTAQSRFGGASALFDGTGDYIDTPDHADFALGSSDWTIDFWFNCTKAGGSDAEAAGQYPSDGVITNSSFICDRGSANTMRILVGVGGVFISVTGTTQFTNLLNTGWHHYAAVRSGNVLTLYIDGISEGSVALVGSVNDSAAAFAVGRRGESPSNPWIGWIDEFRLSVGIARWTTNFSPPILPYDTPSAGAVVVSGITWNPTPGAAHTVCFLSNGLVVRDTGSGAFGTLMASGLNNVREPPPWFLPCGGETVGAGRRLMLFSGLNQVQIAASPWTTMTPIAGPPADWASSFPTFGLVHANRVWGGGNSNDPHRIYYSNPADHDDFTGSGSGTLAIYPGEGEKLVGGLSTRGALILFKYPFGIYIVNTSDPTPANWSIQKLTTATGTLNQHTIVQIENDVLYLDRIGNVHSLQATNEFGDINSSNVGDFSDIPPFMRASMNLSEMQRVQGLWYQGKRQAWFAMPQLGSVEPNFRLILGFQKPSAQGVGAPRFFMSRRDICPSIWMRPDDDGVPKPVFGDDEGFVWLADEDSRNKDGLGYPITFETAATDLSFLDQQLATRSKAGQFLELIFEPRGSWDLMVEVYWDDVLTSIVQFDMGSGGAVLGSFILDTDVLAASEVRSKRKRIEGSGRRFKLVGENAGVNEDISLAGFQLSFALMDERE